MQDNEKPILDEYILQAVSDCLHVIGSITYKHDTWVVSGEWKNGGINLRIENSLWVNKVRPIRQEEAPKYKPCPCCGRDLELPMEHFDAMKRLREEVEKFREVLEIDIKMGKSNGESV